MDPRRKTHILNEIKRAKRLGVAYVPPKEPDSPKRVLSDGRRKKLEDVKHREDIKAKRFRLFNILVHKLTQKFGSGNRAIVYSFVDEFLANKETIQPEDIANLEKYISAALAESRAQARAVEAVFEAQKSAAEVEQRHIDEITAASNRPQTSLPKPPAGSEWQVVTAYQLVLAEEEDNKKREIERQRQLKFKEDLDSQVRRSLESKGQTKSETRKWASYLDDDIKKFKDEEAEKKAIIHKKLADEARVRQEQISDKQKRLDEERERQAKIDRATVEAALEAEKREQERVLQAKHAEKYRQKLVEEENNEARMIRDVRKSAEADQDKRLMREYAAKLEREDYERETAFQKRMEKLDAYRAKYQFEGGGKKDREMQIKFEQLLLKEQQRKEEYDIMTEKKKKEDSRRGVQQALKDNEKILENRRLQREKDAIVEAAFVKKCKEDAENLKVEQRRQAELQRVKQHKYHQVLDHQRVERNQRIFHEDVKFMGEKEKKLNADILNKAQNDPVILSKVLAKAGVVKSSSAPQDRSKRTATAPY